MIVPGATDGPDVTPTGGNVSIGVGNLAERVSDARVPETP